MCLLLTAGVHGDETAPVELLARRLPGWARAAQQLSVDLFVALGNLDALAAGKRFLKHDMNRMFGECDNHAPGGDERRRAELLRQAMMHVMQTAQDAPRIHLDLHTTIRPSLKPTFAVVPDDDLDSPLLRWLGAAGLDAAVLSPGPSTTLSSLSKRLGGTSCTVELGKVGRFGANDLGRLAQFDAALDRLVRQPETAWPAGGAGGAGLDTFRVTRELTRSSASFELLVSAAAPNFDELVPGQVVARDDAGEIRVPASGARVLFPNPAVAIGQRAGLLVEPVAGRAA